MKIAIGSDHRGSDLRRSVVGFLVSEGYSVEDISTDDRASVDYPDVASSIAQRVSFGEADRGILICGTGIGMCVVANKYPAVRAAPCSNDITAELSRRHNDANVLCLSGDMLGERACLSLVHKWLETDFEGGRHQIRLEKLESLEKRLFSRMVEVEPTAY